jgi:hypothetical protein
LLISKWSFSMESFRADLSIDCHLALLKIKFNFKSFCDLSNAVWKPFIEALSRIATRLY